LMVWAEAKRRNCLVCSRVSGINSRESYEYNVRK